MVRDKIIADKRRENGAKGGSPFLRPPQQNQCVEGGVVNQEDNHLVKPQIPESRIQIKKEKYKKEKIDEGGFADFWNAYPRREGRGQAEKAFATAIKNGTPVDKILSATMAYANLRNGKDPTYTKMPATWLNGKCWDDDNIQTPQQIQSVTPQFWRQLVQKWAQSGSWPNSYGGDPSSGLCPCPAEILAEFGITLTAQRAA